MTESDQPEGSGQQENQAQPEEGAAATSASSVSSASSETETQQTESVDEASADTPASADSEAQGAAVATKPRKKKGLLLGLGGGGLVVVIVALVLAAFVWPGFLAGPGKPDDKAAATIAALSSKNSGELDKISCHGPDGKSSNSIPPQAMQLIQSVKQTGPAELLLDTEAQAPMDLTLSAQGQTQTVPANAVFGVTDNEWCMKGLSQRQ